MKYSDLKESVVAQFSLTNQVAMLFKGPPGGGKSALAFDIGREGIPAKPGGKPVPFDNVVVFNASLRDPVDMMGTPRNTGTVTEWVPPKELYTLSKGRNLFIIEELNDCATPMQNGLCCIIYDRKLNDLKLSDETFIIATGNRTQDKSGAQRLTTKLANRMRIYDFDVNLDDWCDWALGKGVSPIMVQFLRFKPNLLLDFSPDRELNPTPRSWERAALVPETLRDELFFAAIAGDVGEGAAAEYTGFRRIYLNLPSIDGIIMEPKKSKVPDDPATLYALTGALAHRVSKDNFDRVTQYTERMPADFQVMCINDAMKLCPDIKKTEAFVKFAVKNANLLL
jgi:hypothetical protein